MSIKTFPCGSKSPAWKWEEQKSRIGQTLSYLPGNEKCACLLEKRRKRDTSKRERCDRRCTGKRCILKWKNKNAKCIMKSFDKKISMPNHMKNKNISKKDKMMWKTDKIRRISEEN